MTSQVVHGKALPPEVLEQVVERTDGVPLFVEELTKMVLESGLLQERENRYELTGHLPPLAIPATLHDSLMARLDRLATSWYMRGDWCVAQPQEDCHYGHCSRQIWRVWRQATTTRLGQPHGGSHA